MMKACWLFSRRTGTGSDQDPFRPLLDAVGGRWTSPGDIIKLTGPAAAPHQHLLVGGIALPDDSLGDGHRHYLLKIGETWRQLTVGAAEHSHEYTSRLGVPVADWYLVFWAGSDEDAAVLEADPDNFPIVYADVDDNEQAIGSLDSTPWEAAEKAFWSDRALNVLGLQIPDEVDRGKRLVLLFLGALLSRQAHNESNFRFRQ
jgi:hypothetical protein